MNFMMNKYTQLNNLHIVPVPVDDVVVVDGPSFKGFAISTWDMSNDMDLGGGILKK